MTALPFFRKGFLVNRVSDLLSCFFCSFACVLATVAVLVVPQTAFADLEECQIWCDAQYPGQGSDYSACVKICEYTCPECAALSGQDRIDCMDQCMAAAGYCVSLQSNLEDRSVRVSIT
jgi:hypothetical protein